MVDGVAPGRFVKRLHEQAIETQIFLPSEGIDTDCHRLMTRRGLWAVGAKEPIPPRQVEAEVAVRLVVGHRVVHAVHVGRHDDPPEQPIDGLREPPIRMVEHRRGVEQNLESEHRNRGCADRRDCCALDAGRDQDLDWVETGAGRDVEVEVSVVHAMQPPQRGYGVECHVLEVDRQVKQDHRERDRDPARKR